MTSGGGDVVGGSPVSGDSRELASAVLGFLPDIVCPKAPHTRTTAVITLARPSGNLEMNTASSAYSVLHTALRTRSRGVSAPFAVSSLRYTVSLRMMSTSLSRTRTISRVSANETLNGSEDSTHPCHHFRVTSNHPKSSPSFMHARPRMPPWN